MKFVYPLAANLLLGSQNDQQVIHMPSNRIELLKLSSILIAGDSLARRFAAHLDHILEDKESRLNDNALKYGWHDHAIYPNASKHFEFRWTPFIGDFVSRYCKGDDILEYDVIFLTMGIHELEERNINAPLEDYGDIIECLCENTYQHAFIAWRLPNEPKTFRAGSPMHHKFVKQHEKIIEVIGKSSCASRMTTIDANSMFVDPGDTKEHTGFKSRRNVIDDFFEKFWKFVLFKK